MYRFVAPLLVVNVLGLQLAHLHEAMLKFDATHRKSMRSRIEA